MRILVVEDEKQLADALTEILRQNRYQVDAVYHGSQGLEYARSKIYDLILLDLMLPGIDGLSVLKALRREHITTPVIILTAKSEVSDIIAGLDAGSDDYLAKPFSTGELLARIRALSRRGASYNDEVLSCGDLSFNKSTMELSRGSDSLKLGLKESRLMELLLNNAGRIMPKDLLIEKIWGLESNAEYNNIEVYISFLRQKIAFLGARTQIRTIRGWDTNWRQTMIKKLQHRFILLTMSCIGFIFLLILLILNLSMTATSQKRGFDLLSEYVQNKNIPRPR